MTRCVVDTNVPIVANGGSDPAGGRRPSISCRMASVVFLRDILNTGTVLLDLEGLIQTEYHRHLWPKGEPGVGDRFYLAVLNSSPRLIERLELNRRDDGEYESLPQSLIDANFDPSDRKFAAIARLENVPVINATDSDWVNHAQLLAAESIQVLNICGCDANNWFANVVV